MLQEREQLEVLIENLVPHFNAGIGLAKIDELRQERQILKIHEADIIAHKDFTYQVQITKQRKCDLPPGRYTTNCLSCNYTCHADCPYSRDSDMYKSSAMNNRGSRNATCTVCPGKCSWRNHVSNSYRFELYQELETRTSDELKAKFDSAMTDPSQVKAMMEKINCKCR